jgi:S-(hydroxymethyl)glutathione dehydrogenase/alcohol dehydrogenase
MAEARTVKSQAAVLFGTGESWKVTEVQVDPPQRGEVLVQWHYAGLCHSDEHFVTGDMVPPAARDNGPRSDVLFPVLGGHEGAGVIAEVGEGVTGLAPGDHVAASFVPSCGRCYYCSTGRQNLCDVGAATMRKGMISDGTSRHFVGDTPVTVNCKVGTFSEYACVSEHSVIKVDDDLPLECVALVSCGVATGWGAAVRRAEVHPGDVVVVVGVGGIGMNAVQGARMAGARRIIAVDPVAARLKDSERFGATDQFASMAEALPAVRELTHGRLADEVILTPGVLYGDLLAEACSLVGKDGTVVAVSIAPVDQIDVKLNLFELAMWNKQIRGTLFGSLNPRADIPALLQLYRQGDLLLDELITHRYPLADINAGYQAMRDGENLRGVVAHVSGS